MDPGEALRRAQALVSSGLDRAKELEPGSGKLELGLTLNPEFAGATADVVHRFNDVWSVYGGAFGGWLGPESFDPWRPTWGVQGGLRAEW